MTTIILKQGRDHTVVRHHPWIFSGGVDRKDGPEPAAGETVAVQDCEGAVNPSSVNPLQSLSIPSQISTPPFVGVQKFVVIVLF